MTQVSTNSALRTITLELSAIEMHILSEAMGHYSRHAYALTQNEHHTTAAEELYSEVVEAYCAVPMQSINASLYRHNRTEQLFKLVDESPRVIKLQNIDSKEVTKTSPAYLAAMYTAII